MLFPNKVIIETEAQIVLWLQRIAKEKHGELEAVVDKLLENMRAD